MNEFEKYLPGPESYREFRETGPCPLSLVSHLPLKKNGTSYVGMPVTNFLLPFYVVPPARLLLLF